MGGMGNQIFQIATLLYFAEKYDTTFSFPTHVQSIYGMSGNIPVYQTGIFSACIKHPRYKPFNESLPQKEISVCQFTMIDISNINDIQSTEIIFAGIPMLLSQIDIQGISKIFESKKNELNIHLPKSDKTKIALCFRTFDEENHNEWQVIEEYYKTALENLNLDKSTEYEFHVFTDRENVAISVIKPILLELNITVNEQTLYEHKGKRDGITDVEHLYLLMDCQHFILCNSTYHYWAAIVKDKSSSILYPSKLKNGGNLDWFKNIIPDWWKQL